MKKAKIVWENDTPISKSFNEGYFSTSGGLKESTHVFLKGNNLPFAWENKDVFTVGESGFGTGLNFLNVWALYEKSEKKPKELYFISVEREPLSLKDLKKANSLYPTLSKYAKQLHKLYPPLSEGLHFLEFGAVKLILGFGDIKEIFSNITCKVNAWFLDGFSPAKNSDMWDKETLSLVKNLSSKDATLSTYSVARSLRDNLTSLGFEISKKEGFGQKRHMLFASVRNQASIKQKPWFYSPNPTKHRHAVVLGAGIAGSSVAYKLAKRGWEVDVIDKNNKPGYGASGNHCGAVTPLITSPFVELGVMYERAFLQAVNFYKELGIGKFDGLKHYAYDKSYQKRWNKWKEIGSEIFTCKKDEKGEYFEVHNGGYLQPFKACEELINSSKNIRFHPEFEVKNITCKNGIYEIVTDKKVFKAPVVIVALGVGSEKILPNHSLALQSIRGQVTWLPKSVDTDKPLCAKGYVCPYVDGKQVIGATYIKDDKCLDVRSEDNAQNLLHVKQFLGENTFNPNELKGRVSFRCSSSDRFPIIGAVGDVEFYKKEYKALPWKKHKPHLFKNASYLPNLFISTAHGSRGLVSAILGANMIISMLEGLPMPIEDNLSCLLHPERFTIRRLQRQEVW